MCNRNFLIIAAFQKYLAASGAESMNFFSFLCPLFYRRMGRPWKPGSTPKKHRRKKPIEVGNTNFRGRPFNREVQVIVSNVHKFFKEEFANGGPVIPIAQLMYVSIRYSYSC